MLQHVPRAWVAPRLAAYYGHGMGSTDLLSLIIATLAVVLSLITVVLQRCQQQREAYRGIYEVLMSEQLQRGRWLISEISRPGDLPKDRSPDFYLIYRTPRLVRHARHVPPAPGGSPAVGDRGVASLASRYQHWGQGHAQ